MDKQTAINLLGGTPGKAAAAMGYVGPHAVYMWPDILPDGVADRVRGALLRKGAECIADVNEGGISHE